jgi:hypothetical protein
MTDALAVVAAVFIVTLYGAWIVLLPTIGLLWCLGWLT